MSPETHGIQYREVSQYKYLLTAPYEYDTQIEGHPAVATVFYTLFADGRLLIRDGYAWDGASGPAKDTPSFMRASLVHDCLYQMIREAQLPGQRRKDADKIMRRIAIEDGMGKFRAWYTYHAVRIFGGRHNRRQV